MTGRSVTLTIPAPDRWLATNDCSVEGCASPVKCRDLCNKHYQRQRINGSTTLYRPTESERFWAKVDRKADGDCWLWTGGTRNNYGFFNTPPTTTSAHRYAYQEAHGPIPDRLMVDHKCRTKLCVNPAHLQLADHSLNGQNLSGANSRSRSGVRGVWWDRINRKWAGQVRLNGRTYSAGHHTTLETAAAAVLALRNEIHTNNLADREAP